jgi:acyl-coenzyme A synthetase/AMP-(fatty) acid ligase
MLVGPFEVESTLMRHPAVAEAAVLESLSLRLGVGKSVCGFKKEKPLTK